MNYTFLILAIYVVSAAVILLAITFTKNYLSSSQVCILTFTPLLNSIVAITIFFIILWEGFKKLFLR